MIRRICDILASEPYSVLPHGHKSNENVSAATTLRSRVPVLFIDQIVAENMYVKETTDELMSKTPQVMLPFPRMFIEGHCTHEGQHLAFGILAESFDDDKAIETCLVNCIPSLSGEDAGEHARVITTEHCRAMQAILDSKSVIAAIRLTIWAQGDSGNVLGPVGTVEFPISDQHRVYPTPDTDTPHKCLGSLEPLVSSATAGPMLNVAAGIAVRSIGIMNSAHVRIERGGVTNDDLSENTCAKRRLARIEYKVLKIKRGTTYIDYPSLGTGDRHTPMSIVRGHFKDYSASGLFGKFKGQKYAYIWVPSHLRGNEDDGVRLHDYECDPAGS